MSLMSSSPDLYEASVTAYGPKHSAFKFKPYTTITIAACTASAYGFGT